MSESLQNESESPEQVRAKVIADIQHSDAVRVTWTSEPPQENRHVHYNGFPDSAKKFIDGLVMSARHYLNGILIQDSFGANQAARREWRNKMKKQYGEIFTELDDSNKLRGNVVGNLYSYFDVVREMSSGAETAEAETFRDILSGLPEKAKMDSYKDLSEEEKLRIVHSMESAAAKVLQLFTSE